MAPPVISCLVTLANFTAVIARSEAVFAIEIAEYGFAIIWPCIAFANVCHRHLGTAGHTGIPVGFAIGTTHGGVLASTETWLRFAIATIAGGVAELVIGRQRDELINPCTFCGAIFCFRWAPRVRAVANG